MLTMNGTLGEILSDLASHADYDRIPSETRDAAMWHVIDSLGVCMAGASPSEPSGQVGRRLIERWASREGATVVGLGARCRPELSALLNGAFAQALEMDDKHGSSLARPGSTVVPAALAVAETQDLRIKDLLTAIVVGYEVMIRLGFLARDGFLERGYHTSSLLGAFGAAAAIGRLQRCTTAEIGNALGIAGTMAAGIQESTRTGSTSKILHGGWGAHAGILATDLAVAGITGPSTVFEGRYGFFPTHLFPLEENALDWSSAVESLGARWHLVDTAYKPYPCCQLLHAFIEGAKQLSVELEREAVALGAITRISCRLAEPGLALVTEPRDRKWAPEQPHEARFSLPFVVATTLVHGDVGLESFTVERLRDPRIRAIAALIRTGEDPDSDCPLHCPAIIEIEAVEKTYRRHIRFHPGSPEAPLSKEEVIQKFARNAHWAVGESASELACSLAAMEADESVRKMMDRFNLTGASALARRPA
jgi:2-methylcitrate dehydratase PrpD